MFSSSIQSPIGVISIKADEEYVYCISCKEQEPEEFPSSSALTDLAAKQLNEYLRGDEALLIFR